MSAFRFHHFKRIDHLYPPTGHTYLENDRGFAAIAKAARRQQTIPSSKAYMEMAHTHNYTVYT